MAIATRTSPSWWLEEATDADIATALDILAPDDNQE